MAIRTLSQSHVEGQSHAEALSSKIREKTAVVGVVGLGYVGLPMLVAARASGYTTVGLDLDLGRIEMLREGRSYLVDVTDGEVASVRDAVSADDSILAEADVIVICVPTPLTDHTPDLTLMRSAAMSVAKTLGPGRLVILESTTYPGTTEEEFRPVLEKGSGLQAGSDFMLAYSPERVSPGQSDYRVEDIPKVVSGLTNECRDVTALFYGSFIQSVVVTSSPREAEMAKLIENTFRHVNIALVNELALVAHELGVDIWEAIRTAASKSFGFMPFFPGPGVGGHCIPIDPTYLSWRTNQLLGYRAGFIEKANEINRRMPRFVVERISQLLNESGKALKGSRILAIGAAYKGGVSDVRGSPSIEVMERLTRSGASVAYHDPYVDELLLEGQMAESIPLTDSALRDHDCVIVLTDHAEIDWPWVANEATLLFDCRGVTVGHDAPNVVRL